MWGASSGVGAATLSVRDRELRMLEYALAASIALHAFGFAAWQLVTPRPEPAAPVPGPISARLVEPPAATASPAPAAAPSNALAEPSAEERATDQKAAPELREPVQAAMQPAPPREIKHETAPKVAREPPVAAQPEPKSETRPRPTPETTPKPKPKRTAKPKPKPISETTPAPPQSAAAIASVAPAPSSAPSASPAPSPGARASVTPLHASASSAAVIDKDLLARYRLQLISAARRYKRYPRAALDNQWEGAAEVAMVIGDNGRIREVTISKSSGHEVLDRQAIDMFRKAKPLVPIPTGLRGREFRVTLKAIYSLRDPGA
jgi:protein TonB